MTSNCAWFSLLDHDPGPFPGIAPDLSLSGRNFPVWRTQRSLRQHQIGHRKQHLQLCGVLRQTLVATLAMPEQVLHYVEHMLDLRVIM